MKIPSWAAAALAVTVLSIPLGLAQSSDTAKIHELCAVCHKETVQDFLSHPHYQHGLECNTCHGDSVRHRTSEGHAPPDRVAPQHEIPALCGGCHTGSGSPSILTDYSASRHGKLVLEQAKIRSPHCGTCHGVHSVREGKVMEAQCKRCHNSLPAACAAPAPRLAAVSCTACHNPHLFLAH